MEISGSNGCGDFPYPLTCRVKLRGIARGLRFTLVFQVIEHQLLRIIAPGFLCRESIYRKLDTPPGFLLVLGSAALVVNDANHIAAQIVYAIDAAGHADVVYLD